MTASQSELRRSGTWRKPALRTLLTANDPFVVAAELVTRLGLVTRDHHAKRENT